MIYLRDIFVKYGDRELLSSINGMIVKGDRIGLIGKNGAGKSTLIKILADVESAHSGEVQLPKGMSVGYLKQEITLEEEDTVMEAVLKVFPEIAGIQHRIDEITEKLGASVDYESSEYTKLLHDLSDESDKLHQVNSENVVGNAEKIIKGLGFEQRDLHRKVGEFSGGWKIRIELSKILLRKPDLLLLDEPTNFLDIESIIWLEKFLKAYEGIVVFISHDKRFLENLSNRVWEIELGNLIDYKGSYKTYRNWKEEHDELLSAKYTNQQKVLEQKQKTINRFMAKATKTKMAQSMQKQLDKIERVELAVRDNAKMRITMADAPRANRIIVEASKIEKSYGNLTVFKDVDFVIERNQKIGFIGQNGQGKSTMAKLIVAEQPLSAGELKIGDMVKIAYFGQESAEMLDMNLTVLETIQADAPPEMNTKLRSILGSFLFTSEDVDKKVSVLSGGERARLVIASLLLRPFNLLILDEPTNHLDLDAKEVLKNSILDYNGALIVISHDRDFMEGLTEKVFEFRDSQVKEFLGDITYYLKKRKMTDIIELEMSKSKTAEIIMPTKERTSQQKEQLKKANRKLQYIERDINNIEKEIEKIEVDLSNPSFYQSDDYESVMKLYGEKKNELELKNTEWEELAEQIDSL